MVSQLLWNSVLVAGLGTLCACGLGFVGALTAAGLSRSLRRLTVAGAVVVVVLPPFLVANSWLHFLGLAGSWRAWWPFDIYSHAGVIWIFALTFWPITFLLCLASWEKLDSTIFEVEPALRGWNLVRWLLWPSSRRALAQAALITFALQMNQFSVPAILQVRVLPAELWLRLSTQLDLAGAFRISVAPILVTLLVVLALRGREVAWPRLRGLAECGVVRRQLAAVWFCCGLVLMGAFVFSLCFPLGQVVSDSQTWRDLPMVIEAAPSAIIWSLVFAGTGAALAGIVGVLSSRVPLGVVAWLLFITPGVLLGGSVPYLLPSGLAAVIGALGLRYFAITWQGTRLAMCAADTALADVVRMESSSRWTLLRHGYWPQIWPGLAASVYLCYVLALWDVETLILIYPPGGETLAVRIFNLLHYGHIGQVNALCLILLGLAVAPWVAWSGWRWIARCRS